MVTFANQKRIECDHRMPKREEEKPIARQDRLCHSPGSSVHMQMLTARSPSTPCSGFQLTVPGLHPILEGKEAPSQAAQQAAGGKAPRETLSLSHPAPAKSQAWPESPGDRAEYEEPAQGFGAGTPELSHSCPQIQRRGAIQGDAPSRKRLPPSSRRHLKGAEAGKEVKGSPGATVALSFPLPSISIKFLFHCPLI